MSAYFDSGFCVRQPSWHQLENLLDEFPSDWDDARRKAGLEWEPRVQPAYALRRIPQGVELTAGSFVIGDPAADFREVMVPLEDHKLIERDDTGATLGVVGQGFELVQHSEMGEIVESIVGQGAKFETAGSCKGGAQVWALAYLDEPTTIANDDTATYPYLALLNAHDGSGACKLVRTSIRVVCWNTYRAAEMEGQRTGQEFTFRHTAGIKDRIEEAKNALAGVRDAHKEWEALATDLFGVKASEAHLNHFLADFIPEPEADMISPRVRANIDKARDVFRSIYLDSVTCDGHRGTALGLVDAAVEYLDHVRDYRSRDTYLGRTLLRPEPLKAKAVTLARVACGV
jgi:phage/plasmid-like protein (TIGR03299 family)